MLNGQVPMFPNQVGASELIGHPTDPFIQRTRQALRELRTGKCPLLVQKIERTHRKSASVVPLIHEK